MISYVHTLGDSVLDSYYWMLNGEGTNLDEARENCVEEQLQKRLGDHYQVVSHAYDGFTTRSVLHGGYVGKVVGIQPGARWPKAIAYLKNRKIDPNARSYFVDPLYGDLKGAVQRAPNAVHYVVLSVGGNDFREHLQHPLALLRIIPDVCKRYLTIVKEIKRLGGKNVRPILISQYRTSVHDDVNEVYTVLKLVAKIHFLSIAVIAIAAILALTFEAALIVSLVIGVIAGVALLLTSRAVTLKATIGILRGQNSGIAVLSGFIEKFYKPIFAQAKKDRIPILDLTNTFNPYKNLYVYGIEPGKAGAALIAEGIDHIVKNHDFNSQRSMIYAKSEQAIMYRAVQNPGSRGWKVTIPKREKV